jgi:hypothetical protein
MPVSAFALAIQGGIRMAKLYISAATVSAALALAAAAPIAAAAGMVKAQLDGYQEVPAVSTVATGTFVAKINERRGIIEYTLAYSDLESNAQQAHIHFGRPGTNGGVSVFLCTNLGNAPLGVPNPVGACPLVSGVVEGVIEAGDVVGPGSQGIGPGELEELLDAIAAGATYVNVHSENFPAGEIRGLVRRGAGPN